MDEVELNIEDPFIFYIINLEAYVCWNAMIVSGGHGLPIP